MRRFRFTGTDIRADIAETYGHEGPLLDLYVGNDGPVVHKWHHYIPLYDRYFAAYRGRPGLRMLEIGVSRGGSLELWRKYFGTDATLFGIDIDETCARFDGRAGQVRIGSQADEAFLREVVAEMGGVDIVLDDGSHMMEHLPITLNVLFPLLEDGGVYVIEDLHTAYMPRYNGGVRAKDNFFNVVRRITDDMHRWYHGKGEPIPNVSDRVSGIHIHDSFVVLEKGPVAPPVFSYVGSET